MHDAEPVRLGDRLAGLKQVVRHFCKRQRPLFAQQDVEVAALKQLHHHVRRAVVEPADVRHARDVLALDPDRGARFALEARDRFGVAEGLGSRNLIATTSSRWM